MSVAKMEQLLPRTFRGMRLTLLGDARSIVGGSATLLLSVRL